MTQQQGNGSNLTIQGRVVWITGKTLFEGRQKTDYNTKQPLLGNDGQPKVEFGFGLAIPKIDPATGQNTEEYIKVWNALHQEAFTIYPSGQLPPAFAMKYKDGDGVDHNGKPFGDREGYPGHIILACTTMIPIKFFKFEGGNNQLVNTGIKNGDYVNVQLNIKAHPAQGNGNAGLYLNPAAVQLIQPGKEIINTPSGNQMFGVQAPAYTGQMVADQVPTMPNITPATPAPVQAPPAPVQTPAAPAHYGVVPPQMQPPAGNAATPGQVIAPSIPGQVNPAPPAVHSENQQVPMAPGIPTMPQ